MVKCKKGYRKLKGKCEKSSIIPFLTVKEADAVKLAFFRAVVVLGGWAIFWGIVRTFNLNEASPLFLVSIGVIITLLFARFAIKTD